MNDETTLEAAKDAAVDLANLVRDELILARNELRDDIFSMKGPALAVGVGSILAVAGACVLLQAFVVERPRLALRAGALASAAGVMLAILGWRSRPRHMLADARARIATDARLAEEVLR